MSEYLFRGKNVENDKWVEGGIFCCKNGDRDTAWIVTLYCGWPKITEVRPETVAPWSGMLDVDGKKIFRDDFIAHIDRYNPKSRSHSIVKYGGFNCSCCSGVYGWYFEGQCADIRDFEGNMWNSHYKVVGNIHDNPELIEVWERENGRPFNIETSGEAKG